jgi:hypothetical protein
MNLLSFVAWLPLVHSKFEPGLNWEWYGQDILLIFSVAAITGYCLSVLLPQSNTRGGQIGEVVIMGVFVMVAGTLASSESRAKAKVWLAQRQVNQGR